MGLTWSGKIDKRHVEHTIGATDVLTALRHFPRHISRPMIVIWDRFSKPRAVSLQDDMAEHPDLAVEWLPP
jgi:hypothetical protein